MPAAGLLGALPAWPWTCSMHSRRYCASRGGWSMTSRPYTMGCPAAHLLLLQLLAADAGCQLPLSNPACAACLAALNAPPCQVRSSSPPAHLSHAVSASVHTWCPSPRDPVWIITHTWHTGQPGSTFAGIKHELQRPLCAAQQ